MNQLCAGMQEEKDYGKLSAMLHEMRRANRTKGTTAFSNSAEDSLGEEKTVDQSACHGQQGSSSIDGPGRKVEISIPAADDLFREIRIENQLIGKNVSHPTAAAWCEGIDRLSPFGFCPRGVR